MNANFIKVLLVCLTIAFTSLAHADEPEQENDSNFSLVKMKMEESLHNLIEQGAATFNRMKRGIVPEPVTPTVVTLKMDKINTRFVEKEDEVYDRVYNLTWSRCSLGQRWVKSKGCVGMVRQVSFDQAQRYINDQWRLPTKAELTTLANVTQKSMPAVLAIDSVAFPDMDLNKLYYWSGSEENNSFAWAVLFVDSGIPSILYRDHRYAVRLVRSGV